MSKVPAGEFIRQLALEDDQEFAMMKKILKKCKKRIEAKKKVLNKSGVHG